MTSRTVTCANDANGNTTTKSEGSNFWRYTWDYENRMSEASTRKQKVRYKFDALGRRVQRYIVGGKENTKFIHDGIDVLVDDHAGTLTKYIKFQECTRDPASGLLRVLVQATRRVPRVSVDSDKTT